MIYEKQKWAIRKNVIEPRSSKRSAIRMAVVHPPFLREIKLIKCFVFITVLK